MFDNFSVDYFIKKGSLYYYSLKCHWSKFSHSKIEINRREREGGGREICKNDLAQVLETKPVEAQLIEKVERREKRNTENTFSQQTSNSRQAERSASTMEPLASKTVIHAGRGFAVAGL